MEQTSEPFLTQYGNRQIAFALALLAFLAFLIGGGSLLKYLRFNSADDSHLFLTLTAGGKESTYAFALARGVLASENTPGEQQLLKSYAPNGEIAYRCFDGATFAVCVVNPMTGERRVISKNPSTQKRGISWSRDGEQVLYVGRIASGKANATATDAWGVFLAEADGSAEKMIATGSQALFTPDGTGIIYLHQDGLHQRVLATGADTLVWPVQGGTAHRYMNIAISPDGKRLAWSDPAAVGGGTIRLFNVTSWKPLGMTSDGALPLTAWQMRFSVDSSQLALSVRKLPDTPALYLYSFEGKRLPQKVYDLAAFSDAGFMTDWK